MANNTNYVTVGKPKVGGAIFIAPKGTTLPTDATTALAAAFKNLGYISDDGFSKSIERSSDDIKAWGGDTVLNPQTEYSETFSTTFLETLNIEVLKVVYGNANVTGTLDTGITIKSNSKELEESVWVIDTVVTGNIPSRIVIPQGKITEIGEVTYKDGEAIGYEVTIKATPNTAGDCHYEYIGSASK